MNSIAIKPGWVTPQTASAFAATMTQSIVNKWENGCHQQVEYIYCLGLRQRPTSYFRFGDAWDGFQTAVKGSRRAYRDGEDKENGFFADTLAGRRPSLSQARALFVAHWDEQSETIDEDMWFDGDNKKSLQEKALSVIPEWHETVGNVLQPTAMQTLSQVRMQDGDWAISGAADLQAIDLSGRLLGEPAPTKPIIIDFKTAKSKYSEKMVVSPQAIHYSILAMNDPEQFPGVNPDESRLKVFVKTKTPYNQALTFKVTQADRDRHLVSVASVREEMKLAFERKVFRPNRQYMLCSKRHCGFWEKCVEKWGGEVRE